MSDIPVYMVVNLKVTDADEYRKYEKGFFPILKKYGGSFLTFDDSPITLEGLTPREGRMIIFSFPSEEVAMPGGPIRSIKSSVHSVALVPKWNF